MSDDERFLADLAKVAAVAKQPHSLMDSQWQNCECEVLVWQTLHAMTINLKAHGKAFSFTEASAKSGRQRDGTDNGKGFARLVAEGHFNEGEFEGNPTVMLTRKCLHYLMSFLDVA